METAPPPGGERRPARRRAWLVAAVLAALLGGGGAAVYASLDDPRAVLDKVLLVTARLAVPDYDRADEEYLVFLTEDSESVRRHLFAAARRATYVTDSLLPAVIVVRIAGDVSTGLAELRRQEAVRMVVLYNPSIGCH
jgi:hypothetical protein